jgi:hypothetical protein
MFHWHDYHKLDIVYKKLSRLVITRGFTFRKECIQEESAMAGAQLVVLQFGLFCCKSSYDRVYSISDALLCGHL